MHILIIPSEHFVTEMYPLAGIFQLHQAKALSKAGHKVGVLSVGAIPTRLIKQYPYDKRQALGAINVYRKYIRFFFPQRFLPAEFLKNKIIDSALELYDIYVKENGEPDVIHAHNFIFGGLIAYKVNLKRSIPYVVTEHSSFFARGLISHNDEIFIRKAVSKASALTAVSQSFCALLSNRFNADFESLPNIVDDLFFSFNIIQKTDDFIFLNVASLDSNKNHSLLIRAFANYFIGRKAKLRIAGDGILLKELVKLCKSLKIENQVIFLGPLTQHEVRYEMNAADCFVLSSKYETFGVVLIEALAVGKPVVATKCGGPEDIVNSKNGLLVENDNLEELTSALVFMYEHASKYYEPHVLRYTTRHEYGSSAFVRRAESLYQKALVGRIQ